MVLTWDLDQVPQCSGVARTFDAGADIEFVAHLSHYQQNSPPPTPHPQTKKGVGGEMCSNPKEGKPAIWWGWARAPRPLLRHCLNVTGLLWLNRTTEQLNFGKFLSKFWLDQLLWSDIFLQTYLLNPPWWGNVPWSLDRQLASELQLLQVKSVLNIFRHAC